MLLKSILLVLAVSTAQAYESMDESIITHWETQQISVVGLKGIEFFRKVNIEKVLRNGGFSKPRPTKVGDLGPIHVFCDTHPETACYLSWEGWTGSADRIEAKGEACVLPFYAHRNSVEITCDGNGLVITRLK